ncbi:UNVERIFIED_CONTAM: Serine/arginine repetitive matrix protein 1 [Sesamum radiatum]|uniref:Serine/arginine repetitive matrix protein 1 n=1 Tax=Sesamum radiatum TaxID=300843 RepID=A0AAW2UR46_SESRA
MCTLGKSRFTLYDVVCQPIPTNTYPGRGTSADQDTRFSNKQAKLLKSQKFAPELENLVDMTKVKMDVMRPWIAKRVTELIGFEDEVLINFIYSLLEGKAVNGKQVHISLTGFMERNTGKFMKELWALLLSAQQNVSGVPQQFLDAKEEETKKKKAETDRIANEIHRKKEKEKQEIEQEKIKLDGDGAMPRDEHDELDLHVKNDAGGSGINPADDKERYKRNGRRRPSRPQPKRAGALQRRAMALQYYAQRYFLMALSSRFAPFTTLGIVIAVTTFY